MIYEKTPSRAEVSDIYNAVMDKADGLILRDETLYGNNPIECVSTMNKILLEAENNFDYNLPSIKASVNVKKLISLFGEEFIHQDTSE